MNAPSRKSNPMAVDPEWLALVNEEIIEPDLPIVDAHFHVWDRPGFRYLDEEALADLRTGHRIVGTVYVECEAMHRADGPEELRVVGETEFANGVAAMFASGLYGETRVNAAIVGAADLMLGAAVQPVLEAHIQAASERFRGIRFLTLSDPAPEFKLYKDLPEGMLADPRLREGFACLAPLGLSFDACLFHPQIPELTALARAFPETTIILNHTGLPLGYGPYQGRGEEVFASWNASMRELGTCPNVFVKIGGLGTAFVSLDYASGDLPPNSQQLAAAWRPFVETCIEAFGAERCMFESDFPVDKSSYSFHVGWNAFKRLAAGASVDEKAALFAGAATTAYRLPQFA